MTHRSGTTLHGQPHRLVEHQHVSVFVKDDRFEKGAVLLRRRRVIARGRCLHFQRRNAHRLPGFQARLRLRALPVHPYFAFADDPLDMAERQARKASLEVTIDAHAGFVGGDGDGVDFAGCMQGLHPLILGWWPPATRSFIHILGKSAIGG